MPLKDRLERRGGLFLDSASTLFFGGGRSGSGEFLEDNSSSATTSLSSSRIGSLPLFFFNWECRMVTPSCIFDSFAFQTRPQAVVFLLQMVSTTLKFGHLSILFLLLYLYILTSSKELVFQGLIHWVACHGNKTRLSRGVIGNNQSYEGWEIT